MHALVVDDSRAMRSILSHILRQLGFEVSEAANGRDALNQLGQFGRFDLALVDWNMPEMNGLEFVRQVRSDSRHNELRLMMVTTETEMSQVATALQQGANEYVMKPFTKEIIQDKLELLGLLNDQNLTTAELSSAKS
jgi:two-component system, chemotaxis family, chemotaxis protein CheY